jgi:GT2 family glycosyltransferase
MLSILVVNWNTKEHLRRCLASIHRHPPGCEYEVIVVDNNSSDGSAEMTAAEFPDARLFALDANTGYAGGNNIAFQQALGDRLLTLNPDTEFEDESIDLALAYLESRLRISAVGIRLVGPEGETQSSVRGFPSLQGVAGALLGIDRLSPRSRWASYRLPEFDYTLTQAAPQPMGTFLLFRREALEAVGALPHPFDMDFPIFFNEVDLLKRLDDAGWTAAYLAEAHVRHHHGASTRQVRKPMIWESHRSLVRYWWKHVRGPARWALPAASGIIWLAALIRARGWHAGFRPEHHDLLLEHAERLEGLPPKPA